MEREARRNARLHLVTGMAQGQPWQEAATVAGLRTSRTVAYRLLRVVRTEGEVALDERRHGHPVKFREPVKAWLLAYWGYSPSTCNILPQAGGARGNAGESMFSCVLDHPHHDFGRRTVAITGATTDK